MLIRFLRSLPLLLLAPFLLLASLLALAAADLLFAFRRGRRPPADIPLSAASASVVIPNWNGRELLERNLPSVVAAMESDPGNEIIVVDNGSADGSAELIRTRFPGVRLLELQENRGFGGGSNAGVEAARNSVVVLLNNDMRVEPDFLAPLLAGFTDEKVFAVSCQIFFSDSAKVRQETGLTEGWWETGSLRVRHRVDDRVTRLFPCFYGGGGSCAFDRRKFLALGGFDGLYAPFYLEDADLGYLAWKRGWKVLYQPASRVYHEHRGTIGRKFTPGQIQAVLHRNFLLFAWKNIHEWRRLASHFLFAFAGGVVSAMFGESPERSSLPGIFKAFLRLPRALRARWKARALAAIDDTEAFRRPYGGYFRDRFAPLGAAPERPAVLFVAPYSICPPVHGGAVFMHETCRRLGPLADLHLVVTIDRPAERAAHDEIAGACASMEFIQRDPGRPREIAAITPHAVREFASETLHWMIHRKIYLDAIDVLQLEYLPMAQYRGDYRRLVCCLFEHDIYHQSIGRGLAGGGPWPSRVKAAYEYMRALRYELRVLPLLDSVQVCSRENAEYIGGFLPSIRDRLDAVHRAGIDVSRYAFRSEGREPGTMLFVGSFRHRPNRSALEWVAGRVMPLVREQEPGARLVVVGSDPPPSPWLTAPDGAIEFRGFVDDVREPLSRYAVFVCPILAGSGIRVKLLEAFAAGIPVVSTRLGAEGLAAADGVICRLADEPAAFADRVVRLLRSPEQGAEMARRARREVETAHDARRLTEGLLAGYRAMLQEKRARK